MRLLVIDDEIAIGRAVKRALCDLQMPGPSGMSLDEILRRSNPALADRIVFMTGGAFTDETVAFQRENEHRILAKPLDVERLRRLLAELQSCEART